MGGLRKRWIWIRFFCLFSVVNWFCLIFGTLELGFYRLKVRFINSVYIVNYIYKVLHPL